MAPEESTFWKDLCEEAAFDPKTQRKNRGLKKITSYVEVRNP